MSPEVIEGAVDMPPFRVPATWYAGDDPRATLLLLPALGTPAAYYRPIAEALAARGIQVLVPELPGTGASAPRPSRGVDYGYDDLVRRYLPTLLALAANRGGERPLVLAGHSLGAQVAALGLLRGYAAPTAVLTLAAGLIHYRYWNGIGVVGVLGVAWLVTALTGLLGYLPGKLVGFGGPQACRLMREWSRAIRRGRYPEIKPGPHTAAPVPALSVYFEGDALAPRRSVAALAALLTGDLQGLGGVKPGNPHAAWARRPERTVACIEAWLESGGIVPSREDSLHV
jgi:predicted alpha/beta hydrolase